MSEMISKACRFAVLLYTTVILAGCTAIPPRGFDMGGLMTASAQESVEVTLIGKIKVWGKEVGIYPSDQEFGAMYDARCISGVMEDRTFPKDEWEEHWAEVHGLLVDWKSVTPDPSVAYVDNNCLAPSVIFITKLRLVG